MWCRVPTGLPHLVRQLTTAAKKKVLKPEEIHTAASSLFSQGQAHFVGQCLYSITTLGVADVIGDETLSVKEICGRLGGSAREESLQRCLRLLAQNGLFKESAGPNNTYQFSLTAEGALLQTNVPGQPSMACGILHFLEPAMWKAWMQLPDYVAGKSPQGKTCFEVANGDTMWDYYSKHETSSKAFNELMTVHSSKEIPLVLEMVPWKDYSGKRVMDIGGGHGAVMGAVKNDFPEVQTLSFDMPRVIESATGGTPPGVEMIGGDMFDVASYPSKLDAIFMKHILHDWDDESCISILKACHGALNVGSKVFVADAIVPGPGETSSTLKAQLRLDILMMLLFEAKERTKDQWRSLAEASGFLVESFQASPAPLCQLITLVKK
eukprot:Skav228627  [mRNA]  locus=scaffold2037:537361:538500:+ [translate_table: standard]